MSNKNILIIYSGYDENGSTATLAKYISDGVKSTLGTTVKVVRARDIKDVSDINAADGYLLGSGDYNGNPEPEFFDFIDTILLAGKSDDPNKPQIANKPFGVFCTSAGYATGAQPVLNSMARAFMTFNAIYVGGSSWHSGQGVCGMIKDTTDPSGWDWDPYSKPYIEKTAEDYGRRLAIITSFFNSSYNTAVNLPPKKGKEFTCPKSNDNINKVIIVLAVLNMFLLLFLCIVMVRNDKK